MAITCATVLSFIVTLRAGYLGYSFPDGSMYSSHTGRLQAWFLIWSGMPVNGRGVTDKLCWDTVGFDCLLQPLRPFFIFVTIAEKAQYL